MATERQIEANRRNAQKSTGPTTVEGKFRASFNALKHGMTADTAVLPYEDRHSYEQIREAVTEDFQPLGAMEQMLVELVVVNFWRLLRARRMETETFKLEVRAIKDRHGLSMAPTSDDDGGLAVAFGDPKSTLKNLERYQTGVERSYFRAVEALRKAQNSRFQQERHEAPSHKIGSVSKTRAAGVSEAQPEEAKPLSAPRTKSQAAYPYVSTSIVSPASHARPVVHTPAAAPSD